MSWPAILIVPTMKASLGLRRYAFDSCPQKPYGMDGHDARTFIGTAQIIMVGSESWRIEEDQEPSHHDPRWPKTCVCGYTFKDDDYWQLTNHRLYTRSDTGENITIREATAGMMWDAPWLVGLTGHGAGPDGKFLVMMLPDGRQWMIDGPSTQGGKWHRTGKFPIISVQPSILSTGYHGWLQNGILSDDIEGRTYSS